MILIGQEYLELKGAKWPEPCVKKLNLENLTEEQKRNILFYRDLIALRLNKKNVTKGLTGSNFHVIYAHGKEEEPVIVFHRWDKGGKGNNFGNFHNEFLYFFFIFLCKYHLFQIYIKFFVFKIMYYLTMIKIKLF